MNRLEAMHWWFFAGWSLSVAFPFAETKHWSLRGQ